MKPKKNSTSRQNLINQLRIWSSFSHIAKICGKESLPWGCTTIWPLGCNHEIRAGFHPQEQHVELCDLPKGRKAVNTKFLYKANWIAGGPACVNHLKTRVFPKVRIHYEETFAPISKMSRMIGKAAIAANEGRRYINLDIRTAFLNWDLEEDVYVTQPSGFVVEDGR